ncbi:hypothetical protein ALC62_03628 [Cyphomyrmex costatus]|uniref:Uncharacterized protein n=1 Tax=Cyphomyrmex costatus TaxID=456900 RepID=A0A195CYY1_9HYME|nr:hypothetical protein ALC62_03628 [Cyphomyrmex costatus]
MFFCNYIGQEIIDHSNNIFKKIYNSRWYATPLNTQKSLIMITYQSMKTCTLTICFGLFIPSLEGFAAVNYTTYVGNVYKILYSFIHSIAAHQQIIIILYGTLFCTLSNRT